MGDVGNACCVGDAIADPAYLIAGRTFIWQAKFGADYSIKNFARRESPYLCMIIAPSKYFLNRLSLY